MQSYNFLLQWKAGGNFLQVLIVHSSLQLKSHVNYMKELLVAQILMTSEGVFQYLNDLTWSLYMYMKHEHNVSWTYFSLFGCLTMMTCSPTYSDEIKNKIVM